MNIEGLSLDQLRVVLAVVDSGSFSAAARRFGRAQSAVSYAVSTLEQQLGINLFDRAGQRPRLTPAGETLLGEIRVIVARSDSLAARARAIATGLEPELAVVVDAVCRIEKLGAVLRDFQSAFPTVAIRLYVEALGSVAERVLDGTCSIGLIATLPELPGGLVGQSLPPLPLIPVAAPFHPLAAVQGIVPQRMLQDHVQLVLSDRSRLTAGRDFSVLSPRTWRIADLAGKHALLRAGLGWGSLPAHMAQDDLAAGRLVQLVVEGAPATGDLLPVYAIHRTGMVPGPAGSWLLARLQDA